jgi:hypothetical protein
MALDFRQANNCNKAGVFAEAAQNVIDRMIDSMTKTAVIFSLQTSFLRRNG